MAKQNKDDKLSDAINLADSWFDYMTYFRRIPGASLGIIKDKKLVFTKAYGTKNIEKKQPVEENTCYRIASISKMFTAVAIMQLAEQNKLQLDNLVSKHLDWFHSEKNKSLDNITIRHLLFHGAGILRETKSNHWEDDHFPEVNLIKEAFLDYPNVTDPLVLWKYSNVGYALLGMVIESVSGKKYDDYVNEQIIKKLGLKYTAPEYSKEYDSILATGYSRDVPGKARVPFDHINTHGYSSATGFISNVEDLSRFLVSLFDDNKILLDASKKEMRRIQWVKDATVSWGLGVQITKIKDTTVYGHSGGLIGFGSCIAYSHEKDFGIVVLANATDAPVVAYAQLLLNMIIAAVNSYDSYSGKSDIDLNKFTCRVESRENDIAVKKINNMLILYNSLLQDPFSGDILEHKKDNTFIIKKGDGFEKPGEEVTFTFANGKVKELQYGSVIYKATSIKRIY